MSYLQWQRINVLIYGLILINEFPSSIVFSTAASEINETLLNKTNAVRKEVDLYQNLFKIKRKEHLAVIQKLILVEDVAKLASFIEVSMNTIVEVD